MTDAKTMTNRERAKKASDERWHPSIPRATHSGVLNIAGKEITCDVLEGGRRVLRYKDFIKSMGKSKTSGEDAKRALSQKIPIFVSANNLTSYLAYDFMERAQEIYYKTSDGRKVIGYDATVLPEACKIYVQAENDGILQKGQLPIAQTCKIMLYGLATVGITSLIDEATGYQEVRARNELQLILEKYISEELREWTKKFPNEFFRQIYRLHGWEYPRKTNHPQYVGKIINSYVYEKLPQGVLDELKRKNPTNENGTRNHRHHQFLSENIGEDNLNKQILRVITIMKVSDSLESFKDLMDKL